MAVRRGRREFFSGVARDIKAWAEKSFRLDAPVDGGGSLRQHLMAVKRSGLPVPELDVGPPPPSLHTMLPLFFQVAPSRPYGGGGTPLPIPHSELLAYCQLTGFKLTRFDVEIFQLLDHTWLTAVRAPVSI